ncbi:hypothetical protein L227DRAFT_325189 [Lentinus tigrinus ALCF2SS1-6]|uniref:Uncharacterized protein n=1 Tax=Lentinus tigrinus ALCF2SS1-6 TaxID=1328759 RepID=A0A5C2SSK0_9APHY|nr:hypothetical protein L227DRAFT_325189 [Lentinus tigrinus ALCF2SS1-6]
MDAVDLNWCLACGRRIELDVCTPYCSQGCLNSDKPSTSAHKSYTPLSSFVAAEPESVFDDDDDDEDSCLDQCPLDAHPASPSRNTWIGRGDAGIRETPSGTLKPKLLLQPRDVKPSLYMSRAQPAPPEPSRPILTPQQSLPSLSRDSSSIPSTSMVSLTTGASSFSVVTPATRSEVGSLRDAPAPRSSNNNNNNFLGGLKAHLRLWTTSAYPQKEVPRSSTVTRKDTVRIVEDSDVESMAAPRTRRPVSPPAFFAMPEQYPTKRKEQGARTAAKENAYPATARAADDHPAYRTRGRKVSRIAS